MTNHPEVSKVQHRACASLANLGRNTETSVLIVKTGFLKLLKLVMTKEKFLRKSKLQQTSCGVIFNLSADDENKEAIVKEEKFLEGRQGKEHSPPFRFGKPSSLFFFLLTYSHYRFFFPKY
jgi:hypothetical protein